jgi:hypothetical protein
LHFLVKGTTMPLKLTIAEAARQWHIGREAIYRKQLRGELKLTTTDPPSVESSEMLRAFGRPSLPKSANDTAILSRVETSLEGLREPIDNLLTQLVALKQDFQAERDEIRRAREFLFDLLASHKKTVDDQSNTIAPEGKTIGPEGKTIAPDGNTIAPGLQRGEMAEAQAVLAAQQRIEDPQLKQRDCDLLATPQAMQGRANETAA